MSSEVGRVPNVSETSRYSESWDAEEWVSCMKRVNAR